VEKKLTIKVISNVCGVLPHTIRTWERRYQTFAPERSASGQRLYSEHDLARAKLIVLLIENGHSISQISDYTLEDLQETISDLVEEVDEEKFHVSRATKKLFVKLKGYEVDQVAREMEHLRLSISAKDFIFHIVLPVMREVGLYVAKGDYSVTQEHIMSTIVRAQLGLLNLPNLGDGQRSVILATPDGNLHELSILIADILCRVNRVSTTYLGASHPASCLAEAANALSAYRIVLGVVSSDKWDYEKEMVKYLLELDNSLTKEVEIILGGARDLAFPKFKNIVHLHVISSFEDFDKKLSMELS